jgi:serine/threonine-protein kinase HipA
MTLPGKAAGDGRSPGPGDLDDGDGLCIPLAGAQEKTALLLHEGRYCMPHGATPTTHILKLPPDEIGRSLDTIS